MRPAAMLGVSERERNKACPHRDQAGVNLARAKVAAIGRVIDLIKASDAEVPERAEALRTALDKVRVPKRKR